MSSFRLFSHSRTLLGCWLSLLLLCLAQAPFSHAKTIAIEHVQGTATLTLPPQRVVVFDVATLDTLAALDITVAAVPKAPWPEHMQQYAAPDYLQIGTLFEPDYKAVQALQPDLIIIAGRSRSHYERLSAIAPTLDLTIDAAEFVPGVRHNLAVLGEIFERTDRAQELDAELVSALDALQDAGAQAGSALVLFTVNGNVMVHAPGDRFGMVHEVIGMPSVAAPAKSAPGPRPEAGNPEAEAFRAQQQERLYQALAQEPDWLFVLDRGAATGGEGSAMATLLQEPRISASRAWRDDHVYYLDPPSWYVGTGGYQGLLNTINDVRHVLQNP